MQSSQLVQRNLTHYWRTNLAVVFGVAAAVAVLAGALLVGDSVRTSLRDLFEQRLGNTDLVITSQGFVSEQLAADLQSNAQFAASGFAATCPMIALDGTITHESSKRVGSGVRVYGVDERFWKFHLRTYNSPHGHEALLSESLARELGTKTGESLLLRIQKPSEIPIESLHSRKEDLGSTLRLTMRETIAADSLGEFSVQPQQGGVRAVFVPLDFLQKELELAGKVNFILVAEASRSATQPPTQGAIGATLTRILKDSASLEDYGIKVRTVNEQRNLQVESASGIIPDDLVETVTTAARSAEMLGPSPFFSYLVNSIRKDDGREIPYSIVTGVTNESIEVMQHGEFGHLPGCDENEGQAASPALHPILLNQWAGADLQAKVGERVTLDYYVWLEEGKLATQSAEFRVACVIPVQGGPDLVPDYPGITNSESFSDWDPPFPIDLKRVRPQDEDYWKKHRTTPKAFIPLDVGQKLWGSRFGKLTTLRLLPKGLGTVGDTPETFKRSLLETLDPEQSFAILPVRAQGLVASQGATDFGEYFLYFSFFLVISALLLAALFFKLGVEQRLREIGLLQAVGFPAKKIRRLFLAEGMILAIVGSVIGLVGALAYARLMMFGLGTWWVDAVGTTMLKLHVSPLSLLLGAVGGVFASVLCIFWTLRQVGKSTTRSLLSGIVTKTERPGEGRRRQKRFTAFRLAVVLSGLGLVLLIASSLGLVGQVGGFFGGAFLLLVAFLCFQSAWLRRDGGATIGGTGWWSVSRLGFRNATSRPGRSVLCIALIASAVFIIVAVDSFRHRGGAQVLDAKSGNGGFPLLAQSLVPLVHDPNTVEGRDALSLATSDGASPLSDMKLSRFRVRPGDDASCLNLYQPRNPKIIAPTPEFISAGRFAFQNSLATTNEEKQNPWLLLNREFPDGAVPVIADANSMTYVLHLKLGDDFVLQQGGQPVRLRLVAALSDSIFQSELVMAEKNFLRLFPDQEGYRFFLIESQSPEQSGAIATALEERLADYGFDVQPTSERLANFHRVENTYLSTFQMLGALGLLLGTLGMAAVLLRNVLERRRELALLRAVGYNSSHFTLMVVAENVLLLCGGLVTGTVAALLAIAPVFFSQHAQLPSVALGLLLLAVLISGLASSILATWAALRSPLIPALRTE